MSEQPQTLSITLPAESAEAISILATEAGFTSSQEYLLFRVNTDLAAWRYHLDNGSGLPVCQDRDGRPAPPDVFAALPTAKTCPDCRAYHKD